MAFCAASYVIAAELFITLLQKRVFESMMSNSGVISHRTLNARRSRPPLNEHKSVVSKPGYLLFRVKTRGKTRGGEPGVHLHVDTPLH